MRSANEPALALVSRRAGAKTAAKRAPARRVAARKAARRPPVQHVAAAEGGDLAARAAQNTLTANPLLGIRAADLQLAAGTLLRNGPFEQIDCGRLLLVTRAADTARLIRRFLDEEVAP